MAKPKRIATLLPVTSLIILSADVQIWNDLGKMDECIYANDLVTYYLFWIMCESHISIAKYLYIIYV